MEVNAQAWVFTRLLVSQYLNSRSHCPGLDFLQQDSRQSMFTAKIAQGQRRFLRQVPRETVTYRIGPILIKEFILSGLVNVLEINLYYQHLGRVERQLYGVRQWIQVSIPEMD